ncbi:GNAT family N-acetyltransferase [Salinicoccus sp. ID82-1]|uniref:GNAT family N-acetyltransferase n=2 Tax=Staphylococcaceae TaxID=90964 RepID=A0A558AUB3_9STAP|nr:GNAT family N-acetyltransferase [Salinicoccus sp. ID82-1]TVT27860.1 GNAT family N-acetyltransferase [Salinicoccus cyprini]
MPPLIRRPKPEDASDVARICRLGWQQTVEGRLSESHQQQIVDFWYAESKVQQDIGRGHYSYVAVVDGRVAGVIGGGKAGADAAEIHVFYVDEAYRYQGVGSMLLDELTRHHHQKGFQSQWVSVQEGNMYGLPFYESRGFEYAGRKVRSTGTGEVQISVRYRRSI